MKPDLQYILSGCQGKKILNEAMLTLPSSLPLSQKRKAAAKKVVESSQVTERQKEARARREAQSAWLRALRATKSSEAKNGANWSFSN